MFSKAAQLLKGAMTRGGGSSRKAAAAAKQAGAAAGGGGGISSGAGAAAGSPAWDLTDTQALPQQQSFDDAQGHGSGDQGFVSSRDTAQAGARGGKALASPLPAAAAAAGASPAAVGSPQFGAWEVAGMSLPLEAMSDTASSYITTRSRRH
jgi:hypothetical protein